MYYGNFYGRHTRNPFSGPKSRKVTHTSPRRGTINWVNLVPTKQDNWTDYLIGKHKHSRNQPYFWRLDRFRKRHPTAYKYIAKYGGKAFAKIYPYLHARYINPIGKGIQYYYLTKHYLTGYD